MSNSEGHTTQCAVCGTTETPDKGWIYKSNDVKPAGVEDGELRFERVDGATAYCSTDCSREASE